jgi:hypothetical protein
MAINFIRINTFTGLASISASFEPEFACNSAHYRWTFYWPHFAHNVHSALAMTVVPTTMMMRGHSAVFTFTSMIIGFSSIEVLVTIIDTNLINPFPVAFVGFIRKSKPNIASKHFTNKIIHFITNNNW